MHHLRKFLSLTIITTVLAFGCAAQEKEENPLVLVLNKSGNSLSILDANSMKLLSDIPVGDSPHEVVVSADGKTAFVANYGGRTPGSSFSVIDLRSRKEIRRVSLLPLIRPHGIQEIGGKIYFTAESSRAIARYDPKTDKVDWIMGTGQNASHMIVGSKDERRFYTANIAANNVTMFELQSIPPARSQITQIPVGKQPEAIDLSPNGKEVWVGLNGDAAIDIVDTASKKVSGRVKLGARPYRVRFDQSGTRVFSTLPSTKEIVVTDASTRNEIKRIKLKNVPLGIIFSKNNKYAFITTIQQNGVIKLDLERLEVVGRADIGNGPDGVEIVGM